jgi:hypothetical protein
MVSTMVLEDPQCTTPEPEYPNRVFSTATYHAFAADRACFEDLFFEFPGVCSYPARQQKRKTLVG